MQRNTFTVDSITYPLYELDTVIVGSGAASLNCAVHLHDYGHTDIAIVTEKVGGGTSNNTGSDKQTFYKLSLTGKEPDSPFEMAQSLFNGGAMHGDLALIEATLSAQEFFHLVQIGVPFPHDLYGGFVGYKTDHDPRQRATSVGPWTSHHMVQCLLEQVRHKAIPVFDEYDVIALLVDDRRAMGLIALDKNNLNAPHRGFTLFKSNHIVFGVGGPGGMYHTSVYPTVHIGAIGLALEVGAVARNLTESQFGLASTKFRWNVSGTYQQVIPRYFSTDARGEDEQEFLNDFFPSMATLASDIFLKGYQWPFDPRKIPDYGSSLIDILVYIETVIKGRRVFMDFRENPRGNAAIGQFDFSALQPEVLQYLGNSNAFQETPISRLAQMNALAIELYRKNGINLYHEPLEVAVCAQHNNGGLAGDLWWQSNIRNLYPVGEVNGSHGVYRPGGSALNAGQVGSLRAAQRIAKGPQPLVLQSKKFQEVATQRCRALVKIIDSLRSPGKLSWRDYREELQKRMTQFGSHIRDPRSIDAALESAYEQIDRFALQGLQDASDLPHIFQNRHLVLAHAAYLEAIRAYLERGGGSRGSYLVMDPNGDPVLPALGDEWRYKTEVPELREYVLETVLSANGRFHSRWQPRRPIPDVDSWFENEWNRFLKHDIFGFDGAI